MPIVAEFNNPFNPWEAKQREVIDGTSVLDYLNARSGGTFTRFERPTICIVNGRGIFQRDYARTRLTGNDRANLLVLAGDPVTIIIYIVVAIIAIVVAIVFAPQPPALANQDTGEAKSVYSLSGRENANKMGQAKPCVYGYVRNWLDKAANAYNLYQDNNQYLFLLLTGGKGLSEFTDFKFGNTPIENFNDVTIEVIPPYGLVTLFRDNVITIVEVSMMEVFAPNEEDYDGPRGPFTLNEFDSPIDRIELDWSLPKGLAKQNDSGTLSLLDVEGYFEYREIDEAGNPIYAGGTEKYSIVVTERVTVVNTWRVIDKVYVYEDHAHPDGYKTVRNYMEGQITYRETTYYVNRTTDWKRVSFFKSLKTIDPQRFTVGVDIPTGRYQIQFDRVDDKDLSFKAFNTLQVDSVRAFGRNQNFYGDETLVAVRALATSNLNNNSAQSFNAMQQRLLEIWDGEEWTERTVTRNPIWALTDACKAKYAGRLSDRHLDLPALLSMATVFDTLGITFDYVFTNRANLWDTLKTILAVGKAIPMLNANKITVIRDSLATLPECMFTPDTMLKGSFSWNIILKKDTEFDGVEVEYTDEDTWNQETMLCLIGDDVGLYPEKYKLVGVTNRNKAYRLGLYYRAKRKYLRETVSFKTNLQGHIPTPNSLVAIVHDLPRWGKSGMLVQVAGSVVTLDEPYTFDPELNYVMLLKQRTGYASQPFNITPAAETTTQVTIEDLSIDLTRTVREEPVIYIIGVENQPTKYMRVRMIKPLGNDEVAIECVSNDNRVYDFDDEIAPDKDIANSIGTIDLPEIEVLTVLSIIDNVSRIKISWSVTPDVTAYVIEYSWDNEAWTQLALTNQTSIEMDVLPDHLYLRVAAINVAQGPWKLWDGEVGVAVNPPFNVTGLALQSAFTGLACNIQWSAATGASNYLVKVFRGADDYDIDPPLTEASVSGLVYSYTTDEAIPDFAGTPTRDLHFEVIAQNASGDSDTPAELDASNPIPPALTGIAASILNETIDLYEIKIEWDLLTSHPDVKAYQVYASPTTGFTPGPANLVFNSLASFCVFTVLKSGGYTDYYFRVVAIDPWGNELDNISAEDSIAL